MTNFGTPVFTLMYFLCGGIAGYVFTLLFFKLTLSQRKFNKSRLAYFVRYSNRATRQIKLGDALFEIVFYSVLLILGGVALFSIVSFFIGVENANPSHVNYEIYRVITSKTIFFIFLGFLLGVVSKSYSAQSQGTHPFLHNSQSVKNTSGLKLGNVTFHLTLHSLYFIILILFTLGSVFQGFFSRVTDVDVAGIQLKVSGQNFEDFSNSRTKVSESAGTLIGASSYLQFDPIQNIDRFENLVNRGFKFIYDMDNFLAIDTNNSGIESLRYKQYHEEFLKSFDDDLKNLGKCFIWFRAATRSIELSRFRFNRLFTIHTVNGEILNMGADNQAASGSTRFTRSEIENELKYLRELVDIYIRTHVSADSDEPIGANSDVKQIKNGLKSSCIVLGEIGEATPSIPDLVEKIIEWSSQYNGNLFVYRSLLMKDWMNTYGFNESARDELVHWLNNRGSKSLKQFGPGSWNIDIALFALLQLFEQNNLHALDIAKTLVLRMEDRFQLHPELVAPSVWVDQCGGAKFHQINPLAKTYLLSYFSAVGDWIERAVILNSSASSPTLESGMVDLAERFIAMDDACYRALRPDQAQTIQERFLRIYGMLVVSLLEGDKAFSASSEDRAFFSNKALKALAKAKELLRSAKDAQTAANNEKKEKYLVSFLDYEIDREYDTLQHWIGRAELSIGTND